MTETVHTINNELANQQAAAAHAVGSVLLPHTIEGFFGADDHYLGRPVGGDEVRSIISHPSRGVEVVAVGTNQEEALGNTLQAMHSLETVRSKSVLSIRVQGKSVDFTELQHYSPKIAPSTEVYPIPPHLEALLTDSRKGVRTYELTTKQEGWATRLFDLVESYVRDDPRGKELAGDLRIKSLRSLTPEQAVKVSLGIVQGLSKYEYDAAGEPYGQRADNMTTMELLSEGMHFVDRPSWLGNGVCRNVASNVKAVFESLKAGQSDLTMLGNTYAVYAAGFDGAVYDARKRDDPSKIVLTKSGVGHAWNTFVTIDKTGSSSTTIVDATWSMGRDAQGALKEPDYTLERMFESAQSIAERADDKTQAALAMSGYLSRLERIVAGEGQRVREQKQQFVLTEWLKLAPVLLAADMRSIPPSVMGTAYKLGDMLDKRELETLYAVSEAGWTESFDGVLKKYVTGNTDPLKQGSNKVHSLLVSDTQLQQKIFDILGEATEVNAESDGSFRARVRQIQPELLPEFNPGNRPSDALELKALFADAGLNLPLGSQPYGAVVRRALRRVASDDERMFAATTNGMSDYDLLVNYRNLKAQLVALKATK